MNNYPPGVTGREYQIAGPDWDGDVEKTCGKPCTITMVPHGFPQFVVHDVDLDACPFTGEVYTQRYMGVETWECPVCGHQHEDDIEPPEPDYDAMMEDRREARYTREYPI